MSSDFTIEQDAAFFNHVFNMIPTSYYTPQEQVIDSKFLHNKRDAPVSSKQPSFDPANYTSVLKQKQQQQQQKPAQTSKKDESTPAKPAPATTSASAPKPSRPASVAPAAPAPVAQAHAAIDALRARLHERIESLGSQRRVEQQTRDKENKDEKRKREREREQDHSSSRAAKHAKRTAEHDSDDEPPRKQKRHHDDEGEGLEHEGEHEHEEAMQDDFQFARVQLPESNDHSSHVKAGAHKRKKSDAALLAELEAFDARIEELKKTDPQKAEELKTQRAIKHSLLRTQGETVRDDPRLLKKSMKRDERQKRKSQAEWAERVKEQQAASNKINAEKRERIMKKSKGDRSKGLESEREKEKEARPGFEGGKKKFLN